MPDHDISVAERIARRANQKHSGAEQPPYPMFAAEDFVDILSTVPDAEPSQTPMTMERKAADVLRKIVVRVGAMHGFRMGEEYEKETFALIEKYGDLRAHPPAVTQPQRDAMQFLRSFAVWEKNGRVGLYHAIDGDGPTPEDWEGIAKALRALSAVAPKEKP